MPANAPLLTTALGESVEPFLRLAQSASAAYDAFTFRDPAAAHAFYDEMYRRGGADFAPPAGRLLLVDGRPAGMFAVVDPGALVRARLRGGLAFARSEQLRRDPGLSERLRLAATTFVRPREDDGYLSRLAVDAGMAGRGLGRLLLDAALEATLALGLSRCVLEVAAGNTRAITLYQSAGFVSIGQASVTDPQTGVVLSCLHLARSVRD